MSPTHNFPPARMSAQQRQDEIAELLAQGVVRLRVGAAPPNRDDAEQPLLLDKTAHRSVHGKTQQQRERVIP